MRFFCAAVVAANEMSAHERKRMVEMEDLLYVIPANSSKKEIVRLLEAHPEIKFVSLVGIDLAGNDTDEKIPMRI